MASHVLDLYTLAVILILISAALSVAMLVAWRANKTYDGFGWWTAGNLVGSSGFVFVGFRGMMPDAITIIAGNMLSIAGLLIALHGIRVFLGRSGRIYFNVTVLALHLISSVYFVAIQNDLVMRVVWGSLITASIATISGAEFATIHRGARRFIHVFAAVLFFGFSILMVARAALTYSWTPENDLFSPNWIQSLSFVIFNIFAVMWTFTFMVLNSQRLQEDLETAQVELERMATTDYLTGMSNNRAFFDRAGSEVLRSQRHGIPLSLVIFDVDHFKAVNDTFGHPGGDRMLKELARACRRTTRKSDFIARLGGEEFGLLLTHADIESAANAAEHFRQTIEQLIVEHEEHTMFVTSSFGVAELRAGDTLESLLARADSCLYRAKELGRNRVVTEADLGDVTGIGYLDSVHAIPSPIHVENRI